MYLVDKSQDTICAVSTPAGRGGISVIRISGLEAINIIKNICDFLPSELQTHKAYYGILTSKDKSTDLDEVIVTYFKKNKSFTNEDTFEISCHGNPEICDSIIFELISCGARLAERGEFTFRAFYTGRIDLSQAEGILSLINSESAKVNKISMRLIKGELSNLMDNLSEDLTFLLAHLEAGLDFSHEDIEIINDVQVKNKLSGLNKNLEALIKSYSVGRVLKDGIKIGIFGKTNVGKSSLLNYICSEEKAIVSDIEGTTRDFVEAQKIYNGVKYNFIDTAGIRDSKDKVEKIGIERAKSLVEQVDYKIFMLEPGELDINFVKLVSGSECFWVINKSDLYTEPDIRNFKAKLVDKHSVKASNIFTLSLKKNFGLEEFTKRLSDLSSFEENDSSIMIINQRHHEILCKIKEFILNCELEISKNSPSEVIIFELQQALTHLYLLLGKEYDDQVMDRVFNEFCIGK